MTFLETKQPQAGEGDAPLLAGLTPAARPVLPDDCTGEQAFEHLLRAGASRLCETAEAFLTTDAPEATHQLRVALRRQRSLLKLFGPALSAEFVVSQTDAAREIGAALSPLRTEDVLSRETLPGLAAEQEQEQESDAGKEDASDVAPDAEAAARFRALAATVRKQATRRRASLKRGAFGVALNRFLLEQGKSLAEENWRATEQNCIDPRAAKKLRRKAERSAGPALDRALKKLRRYGARIDALSIEERHEMRKKAKSLRYAVEFFGSLYEPDAVKPYRRALKKMQMNFGQLNDAADVLNLRELTLEPSLAAAIEQAIARSEARMRAGFPEAAARWRELEATPVFWR